MRRRLLLLVLALPLLAACGGVDATDPVAAAAARTAAGHARLHVDATVVVAGSSVRLRGDGLLARGLARGAYTVTATGSPQRGGAALDLRRLVGYLRQPSLSRDLPRGTHWVRVDLARAARADGFELRDLASAVDSRRVGRDRTGTRYRVQLDLGGAARVPADAWVDDAGFLRRVDAELRVGVAEVRLAATLAPAPAVRVSLPPARVVADAAAVADVERARSGVRDAAAALEAYGLDRGGYLGATPQLLRGYDRTVDPAVRVVIASADVYCVELTVGAATAHVGGPGGRALLGRC